MAFNVLAQIGDPIPTAKDNEVVKVQIVQISTPQGKMVNRIEARLFVDNSANGGYAGPTKVALTFDDLDAITGIVEALTDAVDHLMANGQGVGTIVPIVPQVVNKARKANPAAKKVVRAAKAV